MRAISTLFALLFIPFSLNASAATAPGDGALSGAVIFMADGGDGTGIWLTDWLNAHKAKYEFSSAITGTSSRRIESGAGGAVPVVLINENLKGDKPYAYYAVLIAREAAEFIHIGMPESAEKRYMIYSCMAEVYFELYGTRADLPQIWGVKDEEAGAQINAWVWDGPDGGPDTIAREGKYKTLKTLIAETQLAIDQAKQDGRDAASLLKTMEQLLKEQAYYNKEFRQRETYWWSMHQPS